jgi:dihydrodipicolinate synthase/N-acetylneuraminate lyase
VNAEAQRRVVRFLCNSGVSALFVCGTNGEGPLLGFAEKIEVVRAAIEASSVPVMAQVGCLTTEETLKTALKCEELKVQAIAIVSPYYFNLDDQALEEHFSQVMSRVRVPVFIYNIPSNTGNSVKPPMLARLKGKFPNLAGVKDSSKDLMALQDFISTLKPLGLKNFVGTDSLVFPALCMGADGAVSAIANVFPELFRELMEAFQSGNLSRAKDIQYKINEIRDLTKQMPSIAALKAIASFRGFDLGEPRRPLRQLSDTELSRLKSSLDGLL